MGSTMEDAPAFIIILSIALLSVIVSTAPHRCESLLEGGGDYFCMTDIVYKVSVNVNGTDVPECVTTNGTIPCQSLYYVLSHINMQPQGSSTDPTWLISISSDQVLTSTLQVAFDARILCLILCGSNETMILSNASLSHVIKLESKHKSGSVILSNLQFDFGVNVHSINESLTVKNFSGFFMNDVIITKSADWLINVNSFSMNNSTLYNNFYAKALLHIKAVSAYLTDVNITQTYAKAVLFASNVASFPSGPVYIELQDGTQSFAQVKNCTFYHSKVSNESLQILSSGLMIHSSSDDSKISVENSNFGFASYAFASSISIQSESTNIVLSGLTMHDNYFEKLGSLIQMIIVYNSYNKVPIIVEKSSFFRNFKKSGTAINFQCENCILILNSCNFTHSHGQVLATKSGSVFLERINVYMMTNELFSKAALFNFESTFVQFNGNVTIRDNIGTAVKATYSLIQFLNGAVVQIHNNTGRYGGAMELYGYFHLSTYSPAPTGISFINNTAVYGGGMYVKLALQHPMTCIEILNSFKKSFGNIAINHNKAITKGNQVLFDFGSNPPQDIKECDTGDLYNAVYLSLQFETGKNIVVFPGEQIKFQVLSNEICETRLYVTCSYDNIITSCPFILTGSSKVIIPQGSTNVTTNLKIKTDLNITHTAPNIDVNLHFYCHESSAKTAVFIRNCTLGFIFNSTDKSCHGCDECDATLYQYSLADGVACVQRNYWYGTDDNGNVTVAECYFPFCDYRKYCPIKSDQPFIYHGLPENQDNQCYNNKGKILCRQCRDGYQFTYLGIQCVEGSNCGWNLLGLILLAIILNIIVGLLWIGIMRFKGGLTFGISLGPLIFIAFGQLIPFGVVRSFDPIQVLFSTLSLIILNNSILGYIPLCTPISTGVGQQVLNYIGPLVNFGMILGIVTVTNCCPRCSSKILQNPIQTICLLALVAFWSLATTSVTLLLPVKIGDKYRFLVDPNIPISSYYTLVWILAIPLLIFVIGIIIFMAVSPFLSRRFNTVRIKPILDVFHAPYKNKWRWYCATYFSTWLAMTVLMSYGSINIFAAIFLLIVSIVHFVFQPYSLQWLNVIDTLLLFDLIVLYNFSNHLNNVVVDNLSFKIITIMVYLLSLLPPLCYLILIATTLLIKIPFIHRTYMKLKEQLIRTSSPQLLVPDPYNNTLTISKEHHLRKRVRQQLISFEDANESSPLRDSIINM